MKFLAKGVLTTALALLTGGVPVWGQQPGGGTPAPTPPASTTPAAAPASKAAPATAKPAAAKVNINTADETALMSIKGIGKTKAKSIIEYRQKNGAFKTVDELTKVKGIGEKSLGKFKDQVTVE